MDIQKYDKIEVFRVLFDRAQFQGLGLLHNDPKAMTRKEAEDVMASSRNLYFDYVEGRVMKVNLLTNELNTALYNRDNGSNAAEDAIRTLDKDIPT